MMPRHIFALVTLLAACSREQSDDSSTDDSWGHQAVCSDGIKDQNEDCDDGNEDNDDTCLSSCELATCGDGFVGKAFEECDDGNLVPGDSCSPLCTIEVIEICGDGILDAGEACDDNNLIPGDGCSPQCMIELAICGNGVTDLGEGCDDGNLDDTDACLATCELAACGDGHVWVDHEQCDDGNLDGTDDCVSSCQFAWCGDGFLHAGVEECDDFNLDNGDGCSASCKADRLIFLTSTLFDGRLAPKNAVPEPGEPEGLDLADLHCQQMGHNAGLPGSFQAWLGADRLGPIDRLNLVVGHTGRFVTVDDVVVAQSWDDLTDGWLASAIDRTETGVVIESIVWTGALISGSAAHDNCGGWKSNEVGAKGIVGDSAQVGPQWTKLTSISCDTFARLYCLQTSTSL